MSVQSPDLHTPTLDRESSGLIQSISEHGGYAYVRMAFLVAAGDFRAVEAASEMAWEQLHSGPWYSVLPVWRDAYSMACLLVAKCHYRIGEFKEALRSLDMGLIMGGMLLTKDLDSAVEDVLVKVRDMGTSGDCYGGVENGHPLVNQQLNNNEMSSGERILSTAVEVPL